MLVHLPLHNSLVKVKSVAKCKEDNDGRTLASQKMSALFVIEMKRVARVGWKTASATGKKERGSMSVSHDITRLLVQS